VVHLLVARASGFLEVASSESNASFVIVVVQNHLRMTTGQGLSAGRLWIGYGLRLEPVLV
jgi:hypothetical protein